MANYFVLFIVFYLKNISIAVVVQCIVQIMIESCFGSILVYIICGRRIIRLYGEYWNDAIFDSGKPFFRVDDSEKSVV